MSESLESNELETPQEGNSASKTFDAEYVDKLRKEAAKYRTEAKANADAAKRLAHLEETQQSEKRSLEERIAEMEQQTIQAKATAARSDIAAEFGISKEDRDLFLTASDEDTLRAQAKRLADRDAERKKKAPHVPKEGATTTPSDTDEREFVRSLFGRD